MKSDPPNSPTKPINIAEQFEELKQLRAQVRKAELAALRAEQPTQSTRKD
jgi:hypothetical protein